ncbi:MAG: hypothetical protein ACR2GY_09780 [Phycisphaerales bacterium]
MLPAPARRTDALLPKTTAGRLGGQLPAVTVAMYLFISCILSATWAWLWQDNTINWEFFLGAGLILAGLLAGIEPKQPTAAQE